MAQDDVLPVGRRKYRKVDWYSNSDVAGLKGKDLPAANVIAPSALKGSAVATPTAGDTKNLNRYLRGQKFKATANKVFDAAGDIIPYASNIANSFRRAPNVPAPNLIDPVTAPKVNYDNQRFEADRIARGNNMSADRNLDENSAAAIKGSNLASVIRARNGISEAESNTNAGLLGQNQQLNSSIAVQNAQMQTQAGYANIEATIADQREQSENIANAADKFVAGKNQTAIADLDMKKLNVYSQLWKDSGVYDRLSRNLGDDPTGIESYKKAYGGRLKPFAIGGDSGPVTGDPVKKIKKDANGVPIGGEGVIPYKVEDDAYLRDITTASLQYGPGFEKTPTGKALASFPANRDLFNSVYLYNNNKANLQMTPDQRASNYFDSYGNNPGVETIKRRLKNFGTGIQANMFDTPNLDVQGKGQAATTSVTKMAAGGILRNFNSMTNPQTGLIKKSMGGRIKAIC